MITILHGENQAASRRELERIRSETGGEAIILEGKAISESEFVQATQSSSLFQKPRTVIIENYFSAAKSAKLPLEDVSCDLIFWEEKKIGEKTIAEVKKTVKLQERLFKEEATVFKLVDSLLPGGGKNCVLALRQCLKTSGPEYLFLMVVRQFRLMLNPAALPAWQQAKISKQARLFGRERLACLYRELLEIDFRYKSGLSPLDLTSALELFLLSL